MSVYKENNRINFLDIIKRRLVSKVLHNFISLYNKDYPDLAIFSRDHIGIRVQVDGLYEKPYLEFFIRWLNQNSEVYAGTVLDIGANIGNHSVFFSKYFNRCISFEPNPSTYHLLQYNATLGQNIKTYNLGVSELKQETFMSAMEGNAGGAYVDSDGEISIKLVNLDDFMDNKEEINLIKLDVEGYELTALKGMKRIIKENKPLILFEQHLRDFHSGENKVIKYLNELGYKKFAYVSDSVNKAGSLNKIKNLLKIITGKIERTMVIQENVTPGFYIFLVAIHKDNEGKFVR